LLAALLHGLPRRVLTHLHLIVRPDTILRWHRDLIARRHAEQSRPKRPGRPRTVRSVRLLVLRLVRENPQWGYRRVHGELLVLGVKVAASTVWEILRDAGIDPAPERSSSTWADFLRSQADALLACDFFETITLSGARIYVFAVIEHTSRRIRVLGATAHPTAAWVTQAAKNLVMDLEDAGCCARFLILSYSKTRFRCDLLLCVVARPLVGLRDVGRTGLPARSTSAWTVRDGGARRQGVAGAGPGAAPGERGAAPPGRPGAVRAGGPGLVRGAVRADPARPVGRGVPGDPGHAAVLAPQARGRQVHPRAPGAGSPVDQARGQGFDPEDGAGQSTLGS
jgi:transposase